MRVGINASSLWRRLTGVGYSTLSLLRTLARVNQEMELVFIGVPPSLRETLAGKNITLVPTEPLRRGLRLAWEQCELPRLAAQARVEVLHCPDYNRPLWCPMPVVNTIHDLSYYERQPYFSLAARGLRRTMTRDSVARSAAIIAISQYTRNSILKRFSVPENRVFVIYHGTEPPAPQPRRRPDVPFLLFVGTLESRKNVVTLVRAFGQLKKQRRIPHRLVLAGQPGRGWPEIQQAIEQSGVAGEIDLPGYVSREELLRLYRSADVFVCPSFYEGFGMPILEAMAHGVPVVCSRATCLPEIAGDAAEFFDAPNPEELAGVLLRVVQSPELQDRLRRKGLERAQLFSWEECARRHCEVYRHVLAGK